MSNLDAASIGRLLRTCTLGRDLTFEERLDSTNDEARRRALAGAPHGATVVADCQTAGRGRLGRRWHSPAGENLYLSVILRPDAVSDERLPAVTLAAAVAVARTVRDLGAQPTIRWPNDVLLTGRKVAGILTELGGGGDGTTGRFIVLGIGLDCNGTEAGLTPDLAGIAVSLRSVLGRPVDRAAVCAELLLQVEEALDRFWEDGFSAVRAAWESFWPDRGRTVRATAPGLPDIVGTALGVEPDGALLIHRGEAGPVRVVAGDVRRVEAA